MTENYFDQFTMDDCKIRVIEQISHEDSPVPLHSHGFYEILFIDQGNLCYVIDGHHYRLQPGDILLIPPGKSHCPHYDENFQAPYRRIILWINSAFWQLIVSSYTDMDYAFEQCKKQNSYLLRCSPASWKGLCSGFYHLLTEAESQNFNSDFCITTYALTLMAHLNRTYYYQNISIPDEETIDLIDKVLPYIDTHLTDKITLESIAKHFMMSKSTLSQYFSKQLGVSLYHFVIQRRLIHAKNQIMGGIPVSKCWESCGFGDYSTFYRSFKKEYGISPNEFKKSHSTAIFEK